MSTAKEGLVKPVTVNTKDAKFFKPVVIVIMRADAVTVQPRSTEASLKHLIAEVRVKSDGNIKRSFPFS